MPDILIESLRTSILVSGLVCVMMMLIESMNITTRGDFFGSLRKNRFAQVVVSGALGAIPGCMGGFASVSLYTHGIISFGALIAMMIASSGDEAFVMLAMMPGKALWITGLLLVIGIVFGLVIDAAYKPKKGLTSCCEMDYSLHSDDLEGGHQTHKKHRTMSLKRVLMFLGVVAFILALVLGLLEEEGEEEITSAGGINLLSEDWMYWMFGGLSLIVLAVLIFADDHFVEEHLYRHIVRKHLPSIFAWTFGALVVLGIALQYFDISAWISENTAAMILLAALIGIIPESGPHMVFVTLFASGVVPLPVLLASCISQDGHASLPLFAESKKTFLIAKIINFAIACAVGFVAMALI